jgi:hypothetical protein
MGVDDAQAGPGERIMSRIWGADCSHRRFGGVDRRVWLGCGPSIDASADTVRARDDARASAQTGVRAAGVDIAVADIVQDGEPGAAELFAPAPVEVVSCGVAPGGHAPFHLKTLLGGLDG